MQTATGALEQLVTRGYRLTPQRHMILSVLTQNEGHHLTAEELYQLLKQKPGCKIGIATVYRNLTILSELGILEKLEMDDEVSRYEINHGLEGIRHHHLVCLKCGAIISMQENLIDEALKQQIFDSYHFSIKDNRINLYGLCRPCQAECIESLS